MTSLTDNLAHVGLPHVGIYIGCLLEKLQILIRVFNNCQKEDGNFTSIFEAAKEI